MARKNPVQIDTRNLPRWLAPVALALTAALGSCQQEPTQVRINAESEARLYDMLHAAAPADSRSALDKVEEIIGIGAPIEYEEFERKTGYELKSPDTVDCRLWEDADGEWIAIAFDREHHGAVAYKSNIRR